MELSTERKCTLARHRNQEGLLEPLLRPTAEDLEAFLAQEIPAGLYVAEVFANLFRTVEQQGKHIAALEQRIAALEQQQKGVRV